MSLITVLRVIIILWTVALLGYTTTKKPSWKGLQATASDKKKHTITCTSMFTLKNETYKLTELAMVNEMYNLFTMRCVRDTILLALLGIVTTGAPPHFALGPIALMSFFHLERHWLELAVTSPGHVRRDLYYEAMYFFYPPYDV
jgi:hypothetical protein